MADQNRLAKTAKVTKITNQLAAKGTIAPHVLDLKTQMNKRLEIWGKLSIEKKRSWIDSGKDPIMSLAWQIYKDLKVFFGEVNE